MTSAGSLSLTRDPGNGLLTNTALGTVNDSRGYNGFGEVENYNASHNSTALLSLHYTRDALGRITQKTETQGVLITTFEYAYDLAGRLVEVKQNGVTTAIYRYDQNRRRMKYWSKRSHTYVCFACGVGATSTQPFARRTRSPCRGAS